MSRCCVRVSNRLCGARLLPMGGCSPWDLPPDLQGSSRALGLALGAGISLQGEWRPGDGGVGRLVWPHLWRTGCRVHALESELRTGTQGERAQRWTGEASQRTKATHSAPRHAHLAWKAAGLGGPPSRALLPLELPLPSSPSPPDSKHSVIVSVKDQKPGRESGFVGWLEPLGRLKHCF